MPLTKVSDKIADFNWEGIFQHQPQPADGPLQFTVTGGYTSDNVNWFDVPQTTLDLEDDSVNEVALYYELGIIDLTSNQEAFNYTLLYRVTTLSGQITDIDDLRTHYKQRKLTPVVNELIIDEYVKAMNRTWPDIWTTPDSASISDGFVYNRGSDTGGPKLYPDLFNYSIEPNGPGAPSLNNALRFKYGSGVGNTKKVCMNFPYRAHEDGEKSSSLDDLRRGGLFIWFYVDSDDIVADGPFHLISIADAASQSLYCVISLATDGQINVSWRVNIGTTTFSLRSATGTWSANGWHSLALRTPDSSNNMQLYYDGVLATDEAASSVSRNGWWTRVNADGFDHINVPGQFYSYNSTAGHTVQGNFGTGQNNDVIIADFAMWFNFCPSEAAILDLHTKGLG